MIIIYFKHCPPLNYNIIQPIISSYDITLRKTSNTLWIGKPGENGSFRVTLFGRAVRRNSPTHNLIVLVTSRWHVAGRVEKFAKNHPDIACLPDRFPFPTRFSSNVFFSYFMPMIPATSRVAHGWDYCHRERYYCADGDATRTRAIETKT